MFANARALMRKAVLVFSVLLFSFGVAACSENSSDLKIVTESGTVTFSVELVDTPALRSKGLMFRQELAPNSGMIFDFLDEKEVSFWMRNTFIPLDLIFIDGTGSIVNIHENARPFDETSIPSGQPVRFVFEIAGGQSKILNIQVGDQIEFHVLE